MSLCFLKQVSFSNLIISSSLLFPSIVLKTMKRASFNARIQNVQDFEQEMSVLDLPELALDCILDRLSPEGLCSMAGVCKSMRDRCSSDRFWDKHMKQKWGRIVGPSAYREWQWHIASKKNWSSPDQGQRKSFLMRSISRLWPKLLIGLDIDQDNATETPKFLPVDSIMSWYNALHTGKFWFPAQVYNRENGHIGFMLSCYDAELCYDLQTDTFQARYPPHGRRAIAMESGVTWDRIRAPPVDTSPHDLHISDCLNELRPGDHIEIQWRRNKEFPYGWWYGVVGHLDTCQANSHGYCRCHESENVILEFNQYTPGSRWRQTVIKRKEHREEGNEADGFYGGIRKLNSSLDISTWKQLWPPTILE